MIRIFPLHLQDSGEHEPGTGDRLAFMRICSGVLTARTASLYSGSNKMIQLKQPQQFI